MYILTELVGVVSEVLIIWLFIQGYFQKNNRNMWLRVMAYCLYGLGLAILSYNEEAVYGRIAFCGIGIVFLVFFLYESKLLQAVFTGCAFCAIYMMTDVFIFLLASLYGVNPELMMQRSITRCVFIVTSHILLLAVVSLVMLPTRKKHSVVTLPFMLIVAPGYVIGILLGLSFCKYLDMTGEELPLPFLFASIALLYMNVVLVFYSQQAKQSSEQKHEIEIAEHHFAMQEQYYEQLRSDQDETRALFHDISKHLRAMQALAAECNMEEARTLFSETQRLYHNIGNVVDVGNNVVSVLLNEYKNRAEAVGVDFSFSVSIPPELPISAVDYYIILGNTLDNAIEGALSAPEGQRTITLQLKQHQHTLFYKLENTCSQSHVWRKRDKNHGYGLHNVKKCIEKYSGDMTTSAQNGKFVFMARLTCAMDSFTSFAK